MADLRTLKFVEGPLRVVTVNKIRNPSALKRLTAFRWIIVYGVRIVTKWDNRITSLHRYPEIHLRWLPFWSRLGTGAERTIPVIEPDHIIIGIFTCKDIDPAIAVEIPKCESMSLGISEALP